MPGDLRIADIPVLDIGADVSGGPGGVRSIAKALDEAFRNYGFLTLTGHGIQPEKIQRMRRVCRQFFQRPSQEKLDLLSRPKQGRFCGYVPFALDSAAVTYRREEAPPDLRERYRAVISDSADVRARVGANQWPGVPSDFERIWRDWYRDMAELANRLIRLCAQALSLGERDLDPFFNEHFSVLVGAFSPPVQAAKEGQMRCGEHCDFGTLTIVHQDEREGGLEIFSGNRWLRIPPRDDAFVVNIGDLMARWTNDRWVSTLHRVALPSHTGNPEGRLSLIFFNQPNLHAEIRCLATCTDANHPPKYPPTTLQDHFTAKQARLQARQAGPDPA